MKLFLHYSWEPKLVNEQAGAPDPVLDEGGVLYVLNVGLTDSGFGVSKLFLILLEPWLVSIELICVIWG